MFVNVSPADYNTDEVRLAAPIASRTAGLNTYELQTINSLRYAKRVKDITNDAQKNAESEEINRLKGIIAKWGCLVPRPLLIPTFSRWCLLGYGLARLLMTWKCSLSY